MHITVHSDKGHDSFLLDRTLHAARIVATEKTGRSIRHPSTQTHHLENF